MGKFSKGRYSLMISDRSGAAFPYREMVQEWNGAWVHNSEYEPKQPQVSPRPHGADPQALPHAKPARTEFAVTDLLKNDPLEILQLGKEYKRTEIGMVLNEENLGREGIYYSKEHNITILFTDLEKGKDSIKYNDFFENDYFNWDSQTIQHINTPRIQEILK